MNAQVLLAAYNGAAWLPEQLSSLSRQTDSDFTVLYQDDGSSDGTPEALERFRAGDARLIPGKDQGRRLGARGNFLSLIRQTKADAALLCDQDDIWEERKIGRLKETLRQAEEQYGAETPLLVHSDCRGIDESGGELFESLFRHQGWDPGATDLARLLVQNNVTGCTLIMNRPLISLVADAGDPERLFMHDWFIALTAAAFGKILFVDEPLTRYRQHAGNAVGASAQDQITRGFRALSRWEQGKARIRLTYEHTRAFRELYGSRLPAEAARIADAYLATETMPKIARVTAVKKQGCVMQSPVTRLGQILFG